MDETPTIVDLEGEDDPPMTSPSSMCDVSASTSSSISVMPSPVTVQDCKEMVDPWPYIGDFYGPILSQSTFQVKGRVGSDLFLVLLFLLKKNLQKANSF